MSKPGFPPTARVAGAVSAVALLALAAACSSSSGKSNSPSSSSSGTSGTTVNSGSASVNGAQTAVLTAPDGHTLYYFTPDTAGGKPTCTGSCAATWPALTATSPTEATTATGTLTVVSGQVVYNGHPLYEFTGDSAAGQANGEGTGGTWYVATPTLATGAGPGTTMPSNPSMPSSSSGSSTSGGGGGYHY
ncbi:putative lipoprotein with Yx(FWY)xxD motif [Catenulispora sp. GAS73]|uniref:COG4315 family predicted lipoprotein n=1 Tax=Catenulispora sp. GAS73 TaxID=3156269 RepID=UPI0035193862